MRRMLHASRRANALGVEAHVLHADDFLAFMSRNWLVRQVEDSALHRVPQWLRQGLDLIPGRAWETDEAITH